MGTRLFTFGRELPLTFKMATRYSTVGLPSTFKNWSEVSNSLQKIREGKVRELEEFEKVYTELEYQRESEATPTFSCLRHVLKDGKHVTEHHFFSTLLPWLANKALQVEELFKAEGHHLPVLRKQVQKEVLFSREQVCCLLSHAFFGTLAPPDGGFQRLAFTCFLEIDIFKSQRMKLLCILHYFDRLRQAECEGDRDFLSTNVSVRRRAIQRKEAASFWGQCDLPLTEFSSDAVGLIEESHGDLQVDFANAYIGGGVLQMGNVQEEIRFVINPECLVSMLICEDMDDNEAILIQGAEQFSQYKGYGWRFEYNGPHADTNPLDNCNRRCVSIVAIDAIPMNFGDHNQYQRYSLARELDKAYCGFSFTIAGDNFETKELKPVATGNWGCGAFGGDKDLKTMLQWMAASMAGRPVKYYTFSDEKFSEQQVLLVKTLRDKRVTVGQLYRILVSSSKEMAQRSVFQEVMERVMHDKL